jgi:hypothetical protein
MSRDLEINKTFERETFDNIFQIVQRVAQFSRNYKSLKNPIACTRLYTHFTRIAFNLCTGLTLRTQYRLIPFVEESTSWSHMIGLIADHAL